MNFVDSVTEKKIIICTGFLSQFVSGVNHCLIFPPYGSKKAWQWKGRKSGVKAAKAAKGKEWRLKGATGSKWSTHYCIIARSQWIFLTTSSMPTKQLVGLRPGQERNKNKKSVVCSKRRQRLNTTFGCFHQMCCFH